MMLSDVDFIRLKEQLVEPFHDSNVQPSTYDLSLDEHILIPIPGSVIDLRTDSPGEHMSGLQIKDRYVLPPGGCILGSTKEIVKCPTSMSARIEGKSSLGRLFLAVHITAGVIDAGWYGQITLEIVNHGPWNVVLWPGMKIAQLSYFQLTEECQTPYGSKKLGSHYLGQRGPTPSVGKRGK